MSAYDTGTYDGRVAIFRAAKQMLAVRRDPTMGWGSKISGELEIHTVPGFHDTILFGPRLQQLAELLNESLEIARAAESND
jgi:thioesterase domain-containing protein